MARTVDQILLETLRRLQDDDAVMVNFRDLVDEMEGVEPKDRFEPLSREDLIAICEAATVNFTKWDNRDSAAAHQQLGECWSLLIAGCHFTATVENDRTIVLTIWFPGFHAFEVGRGDRSNWEEETFYLPTWQRLAKAQGQDWY